VKYRLVLFWSILTLLLLSACEFGTRFIFTSSREVIATPDQMGIAYEEVWFISGDGFRLQGWFLPGATEKPLVLVFHGNSTNVSHSIDFLRFLHNLGFPVFIFDYRGFGFSEGRALFERDLWQDAWGALNYMHSRGWEPKRMIYFGHSLGAAVALQMALDNPPAGVVLESPFTSLRYFAWRLHPLSYSLFGRWCIGNAFDNLGRISQLAVPLLIFHGYRDQVVPNELSQLLFDRAPEPKILKIIPGADHVNALETGGADYRQAWLDFLALLEQPSP
jgi:uncharacterized protein